MALQSWSHSETRRLAFCRLFLSLASGFSLGERQFSEGTAGICEQPPLAVVGMLTSLGRRMSTTPQTGITSAHREVL